MSEVDPDMVQTQANTVTNVDVQDGALVFQRYDGSDVSYSFLDVLPTTDPETDGVLWNDDGTIKISDDILADVLASLPTTDPSTNGELWNDSGTLMVSFNLLDELPTSNPGVDGAMWNSSGTYMVSSGPLG